MLCSRDPMSTLTGSSALAATSGLACECPLAWDFTKLQTNMQLLAEGETISDG
jgi:hypothetical protein